MSENLRKLVGVAVMAAIVIVGVVMTNGGDTIRTRNLAFGSGDTGKDPIENDLSGSSENDLAGAGLSLETGGSAEGQLAELLDRSLKFVSPADIREAKPAYTDHWYERIGGQDDNNYRTYYDRNYSYHLSCDGSRRGAWPPELVLWVKPRNENGDSRLRRSSISQDKGIPRYQSFQIHKHNLEGWTIDWEWVNTLADRSQSNEKGPQIMNPQFIPKTTLRGMENYPQYVLLSLASGDRVSANFSIAQWKNKWGVVYPIDERENVLLSVSATVGSHAENGFSGCDFAATFVRSYP